MTKIMVIDDDEDFTNLYKTTLMAAGFETIAVNQSSAAVEMAYLVQPDIFLIDLMMPDIDGFQMCKMLRQDRLFKQTPIIIITALNDEKSKNAAMEAGANDYLNKPFRIDELKIKVNKLIGN
jgi:DNA-binding response OmpR family regulator